MCAYRALSWELQADDGEQGAAAMESEQADERHAAAAVEDPAAQVRDVHPHLMARWSAQLGGRKPSATTCNLLCCAPGRWLQVPADELRQAVAAVLADVPVAELHTITAKPILKKLGVWGDACCTLLVHALI